MKYRITTSNMKKLSGKKMTMSMADNKTSLLWREFMKNRHIIKNGVSDDLYALQIYDTDYFSNFDPDRTFVKYALCEVSSFDDLAADMISFTLPAGLYAVFTYKGAASEGANAFQYIFSEWLPQSGYQVDERPHFELLGEKYKNNDPDSEEEIWIPVKPKNK